MSDVGAGFEIPIVPRVDRGAAARVASEVSAPLVDAATRSQRAFADMQRNLVGGLRSGNREMDELLKDARALGKVIQAQGARKFKFVDEREFALLNRSIEKLQAFQDQARATDFTNPAAVRKLRQSFDAISAEATKASNLFRSTVKDQVAAAQLAERRKNDIARAASRERQTIAETEASKIRFAAQRAEQVALSNTQRTNALRLQSTRFLFESLGRLERGFGSVVSGIARTATRGVGRIYSDTLGRVSQAFQRNSSRIEHIERSSSSRRLGIFRSTLSQQERLLSQSITRQQVLTQRAQQQANRGVIGTARRSSLLGLGGGLAGVGVLSLGLERFSNLERLNRQFEALTGSAETTRELMAQISDFARETPFDLVGVADLAKGFLAIKTPADQVLPRVRAIADAVALTGGGTVELTRIQRAIGQIISAGKLQGDEINQLAESLPGLNIRQIAADLFGGGSFATFQELNDAGKISGEQFVNGLITTLAADPRLAGASEDLAKTLGGRLANLKEVLADTGAAFIGTISGPLKAGTVIATQALDGLAQFIRGNVSGAFDVLRTAVGGAALAIGGLLVAKTAAEALRLLGTAARFALTPFGSLVVVVGALGAAFAVMRDKSQEFRDVTDRLGRLLGTQFRNIFEAVGTAIGKVRDAFADAPRRIDRTADAFERSLAPTRSWISEVGSKVGSAIGIASRFLTDRLIPALANVAIFIGRRIGPAFSFLREQFDGFVRFTAPFVERGLAQITRGFDFLVARGREVVESVREIASGVRSALGPGLIAGGAGLLGLAVTGPVGGIVAAVVAGFATLSPTLRDAVTDGLSQARQRIVTTFRGINWSGLAQGALRFVNRVGNILGQIVSDRRFLTALAGIAATAGAVAVNFVTGFVSGVLSNIGDIRDVGLRIAEAIAGGITQFFSSGKNIALVAALGTALLAGRALFRVGQRAAAQFQGGFGAGLASARQGGSLLSGIFGGPSAIQSQARVTALKSQKALDTEFRRLNQTLRGGGFLGTPTLGRFVRPQELTVARNQLQQMESVLGSTGVAAARVRGAFSDLFSGIRANAGSVRGLFTNIGQGLGDVRNALRGQGAVIGAALGAGVAGAFASALGGQQLGSGNVVGGLGGILASSLLTGLAVGGPAGLAAGGVVAGLGLITAAITASGQASKKAAAEVKTYKDALLTAARAGNSIRQALLDSLFTELEKEQPKTRQALDDLGLTVEDFASIASLGSDQFKEFLDAANAMDDVKTDNFAGNAKQTEEAIAAISRVSDEFTRNTLTSLLKALQSGAISWQTYLEVVDALRDETREASTGFNQMRTDLSLLGGEAKASVNPFSDLGQKIRDLVNIASGANPFANLGNNIRSALGGVLDATKTKLDAVETAAEAARTRVQQLLNPGAGTFGAALDDLILTLPSIGANITGLDLSNVVDAATLSSNLEDFRGNLATAVQKGIDDGLSESDIDTSLENVKVGIDQLDVPDDVKAALKDEVQKAIDIDAIPVDKFDVDTSAASLAGQQAAEAARSGARGVSTTGVGSNFVAGIASGIRGAISRVTAAAREAAEAARLAANRALLISSPSKVGIGIGQNFGDAMAQGIDESVVNIARAAREAAETAADSAREVTSRIGSSFSSILAGGSREDAAKVAINAGLGAILSDIQSTAERAASAAAAAAQPGATADTRAEAARAAAEAANRSIALNLEGIGNRSNISSAVENIKSLGDAMLDAGRPVSEVADTLIRTRNDLINFAGQFGFNIADVTALIDELGLSILNIQKFAEDAAKIPGQVADELKQRQLEDALEKARQESGSGGETNVTVNLALPFGDPQAVALSVSNSIARSIRR